MSDEVKIDPETLERLRTPARPGVRWAVYRDSAFDSSDFGRMMFLAVGPGCTYEEAPERLPDIPMGTGWKFRRIGWADLDRGVVTPLD